MTRVEVGRQPLTDVYPREIAAAFPTLERKIAEFLERNAGKVATLKTPAIEMAKYANEMQSIAKIISDGIQGWPVEKVIDLYRGVTQPARLAGVKRPQDEGQVGLILGKHRYHMLERTSLKGEDVPSFARSLLMLLQRIPHGDDTGAEVHGLRKVKDNDSPELKAKARDGLVPADIGGVEIYLPLVKDVCFYVNDQIFRPQELGGLITILPGDSHHHIKKEGSGPVRLLLLGGFGFSRASKTEERFEVEAFSGIPRFIPLEKNEQES